MTPTQTVLQLAPQISVPARIITAKSYFIDRIQPDCEILALPPGPIGGGEITLVHGPLTALAPRKPGLAHAVARRLRPAAVQAQDGVLFDLRAHAPGNWAHFLNNHIPFVTFACRTLGLALSDCVLVLPADAPGYIRKVAGLFGMALLCTDATVTGTGVAWRMANWPVFRAARAQWVQDPEIRARVAAMVASRPIPPRLFLSRRKTRHLENPAEIEALMSARGFVTIYPEDLPAADQFRLFEEAETIVAIHGAGLAPLLYRSPKARLERLIEIFPIGHMTDVYRMMASQLGLNWIGVRGRIKPEHVIPAYDLNKPFVQFSQSAFAVDPAALTLALDMMGVTGKGG